MLRTVHKLRHVLQAALEGEDGTCVFKVEGWFTLERHFADHAKETKAYLRRDWEEGWGEGRRGGGRDGGKGRDGREGGREK